MKDAGKKFQFVPFIINLLIPLFIGATGRLFTAVEGWYQALHKTALNPPDKVFGPVWTLLYVLIGVASFLIWRRRRQVKAYHALIALYFTQLVLNLGWSFIFFNQHLLGAALAEIIALLIVIIINAIVFYRVNKTAGLLYIPYILWVGFATYLTYSIYILN